MYIYIWVCVCITIIKRGISMRVGGYGGSGRRKGKGT